MFEHNANKLHVGTLASTLARHAGPDHRTCRLCCCPTPARLQSSSCTSARQDAAPCSGELLEAIKAKWGSLDAFVSTFNTTTAAVQVRPHARRVVELDA